MNNITKRVASFISSATVPQFVRDKARKVLVDTIGVILSGPASEVASPLLEYAKRQKCTGSAVILGTSFTTSSEIAALVNGTFGHALDFDDGIVLAPVHPSSVIVSALLSATPNISGRRLIDAYVVGVEVTVKLAEAIGIDHYHRGWHGTGTIGVFGAVAALAYAKQLDPLTTCTAFGLASSMTSGVQRNFGTMTKPLHTGWAARNGVVAVELASAGFSAATDVLEAENGFFAVYGNEQSNLSLLDDLGKRWVIDEPGMSLKRYACCYASHRPMVGLLDLRQELDLTPENTLAVKCYLAPGSLRALIYPRPKTGLEGKFSLEYALAAGVLDGGYSLWSFTDAAVMRSDAQALLPRIEVSEDPRCAIGDPYAKTRGPSRRGFVEVHASTTDGRNAMRRINIIPGSPDQALSWDDIRRKFMDCASTTQLDIEQIQKCYERLITMETCNNVQEIISLLRT